MKKKHAKLISIIMALCSIEAYAQIENIERVSVNNMGEGTMADSQSGDISGDGNLIVFASPAENLVDDDNNSDTDIFVFNRALGNIVRVSVASDGSEANRSSSDPKISRNGRFVAFRSRASNLVEVDTNGRDDVFVHDLILGTTQLVSLSAVNNQGPTSAFLRDVSADGQQVLFLADFSDASDDTPGQFDLWLRDLSTDTTTLVSQSSAGVASNDDIRSAVISSTGQWAAFISRADNLVEDDTNNLEDVFLRDLITNQTSRVSLTPTGEQLETGVDNSNVVGGISDDGRFIAFQMSSNDLLDPMPSVLMNRIIRHDRQTGANELVNVEHQDENSFSPSLSADGNIVTYYSPAEFFSTEADVYARNMNEGVTILVSQNILGESGNDSSFSGEVSDDGSFVSFISVATNLVDNDMNGRDDVFVAQLPIPNDLIFLNGFE